MGKTALQQLKEKLQTVVDDLKDAIPGTDQYGYRDAMRNVILDIDMQMIPVERDAFVKTWEAGKVDGKNISYNGHSLHESGEQYYETRYGSSFK